MMQFKMLQRLSRRLHVRIEGRKFNDAQAQFIEDTLMACEAINKANFYTRSGDIIIKHNGDESAVKTALFGLQDLDLANAPALHELSPRLVNKRYKEEMIDKTLLYIGKKSFYQHLLQQHGPGSTVSSSSVQPSKHCGNAN